MLTGNLPSDLLLKSLTLRLDQQPTRQHKSKHGASGLPPFFRPPHRVVRLAHQVKRPPLRLGQLLGLLATTVSFVKIPSTEQKFGHRVAIFMILAASPTYSNQQHATRACILLDVVARTFHSHKFGLT